MRKNDDSRNADRRLPTGVKFNHTSALCRRLTTCLGTAVWAPTARFFSSACSEYGRKLARTRRFLDRRLLQRGTLNVGCTIWTLDGSRSNVPRSEALRRQSGDCWRRVVGSRLNGRMACRHFCAYDRHASPKRSTSYPGRAYRRTRFCGPELTTPRSFSGSSMNGGR